MSNIKTYVCFMNNGMFKIGKSKNPFNRINGFKTSNPILSKSTIIINDDIEFYLHDCFESMRIDGEWFYFKWDEQTNLIDHIDYIHKLIIICVGMKNKYLDGNLKFKEFLNEISEETI